MKLGVYDRVVDNKLIFAVNTHLPLTENKGEFKLVIDSERAKAIILVYTVCQSFNHGLIEDEGQYDEQLKAANQLLDDIELLDKDFEYSSLYFDEPFGRWCIEYNKRNTCHFINIEDIEDSEVLVNMCVEFLETIGAEVPEEAKLLNSL